MPAVVAIMDDIPAPARRRGRGPGRHARPPRGQYPGCPLRHRDGNSRTSLLSPERRHESSLPLNSSLRWTARDSSPRRRFLYYSKSPGPSPGPDPGCGGPPFRPCCCLSDGNKVETSWKQPSGLIIPSPSYYEDQDRPGQERPRGRGEKREGLDFSGSTASAGNNELAARWRAVMCCENPASESHWASPAGPPST